MMICLLLGTTLTWLWPTQTSEQVYHDYRANKTDVENVTIVRRSNDTAECTEENGVGRQTKRLREWEHIIKSWNKLPVADGWSE